MTAYVDAAIWEWRGQRWCHLLADSLEELHQFASELGLRHEWFQAPPRVSYPHYDITADTRAQAMRKGAVAAGRRLIVEKAKALRLELLNQGRSAAGNAAQADSKFGASETGP